MGNPIFFFLQSFLIVLAGAGFYGCLTCWLVDLVERRRMLLWLAVLVYTGANLAGAFLYMCFVAWRVVGNSLQWLELFGWD